MGRRLVWDTEAKNLLNWESIDYNASPYKLRDPEYIHCVGLVDVDTGEEFVFRQKEVYTHLKQFIMDEDIQEMIGHNVINYDHLSLKLAIGLDYSIGVDGEPDKVGGKNIIITDTLVLSKTLNPDRHLHSIDYFGGILGLEKINWRAKAIELELIQATEPKGAEFRTFHEEMVAYMMRDIHVNIKVWKWLLKERGDWKWESAYATEKAVAEIITRQEHRGFKFNKEKAIEHVRTLDAKMVELSAIVEPLIPPKPLTKGALDDLTPCTKQFKKNGEPVSHILNFAKRHGGEFLQEEEDGKWRATLYGRLYELPMPSEPLWTEAPAKITDTLHIKEWLVGMGWEPTQYKERDLTVDSKKKKVTKEKFDIAVDKWIEQTFSSNFKNDRLEMLEYSPRINKQVLANKLKSHDHMKRPLVVYTNPTLTVGMEKEIDPKLLDLEDKFAYAKEISHYLTYRHRRNSILGGGIDPDDDDDMQKGWMSVDRINEDGRIPTPADTCGAATSRFKHRLVANVPRVTSMFGKEMRELFGVDDGFYQLGYDFDSLEAKIESHYVFRYEGGPAYGVSLTAEKPNDCHSVLAKQISELLGRPFPRGTAKNVKYGCFPVDNTEVLTPSGWKKYADLSPEEFVYSMDTETGEVSVDNILDIWHYTSADVSIFGHSKWNVECTEDHRWFGRNKFMNVSDGDDGFFLTNKFQTNFTIKTAGKFVGGSGNVTPEEAAVMAWILSDGYYKWSDKPEGNSSCGKLKQGIVGSIAQSDHKFQAEVKQALLACGLKWEESKHKVVKQNQCISYRLKSSQLRDFIDRVVGSRKGKHEVNWVEWALKLSVPAMQAFVDAFWLADGRTTVKNSISLRQNRGSIADALVVIGNMLGYKVTQTGGKCSTINYSFTAHVGLQTAKLTPSRKTDVFCITTGKGTFIMRQNGIISVTGNCSYNAQVKRVAKTVGCSLEEAQVIFDTFWEQAFPLKQLKEAMQQYWETKGEKKFLLGIDGRKLPIRSKGNVINTAFQSAGVICAKRAMIVHDRLLKKEGLSVDFFLEDWKNKEHFCQQLCAYHKLLWL